MKTFRPVITLIIITMILPELLTGNTLLSGFFDIRTLLILFFGYGIAVLLVREFSVRNNLSYGGVFILGFAYAILNEGLLAKTMILSSKLPIPQFDNYGYFLGMNFPWSAWMMLWHAVCSVFFPILFVHTLFPQESMKPWIDKKLAIFLFFLIISLGILSFLGNFKIAGTPEQLSILLAMMSGIIILAIKTKNENITTPPPIPLNTQPIWLGLSTVLFFFLIIVAGKKIPASLFFIAYISGIWLYVHILTSKSWIDREHLLLFATGCFMLTTFLGMVVAFTTPSVLERLVAGLMGESFLIFAAKRVFQKSKERMKF